MVVPEGGIEERPSPNHGERAAGKPVDILLLHYTGMHSEDGALAWLTDPRSQVSAHYLVREDGRVTRMVDEGRRAWHAGRSFWAGETDINSRSIGIEICNPGHEFGYRAFPDVQIAAVIRLARGILARHAIPPERVLAHSDVAPARKEDPGEKFPWATLAAAGIGHWAAPVEAGEAAPVDIAPDELANRFRAYGYGLEGMDENGAGLIDVVTAFQRHFRPARVDGIADASTVATLERLTGRPGRPGR